MPTDTALSPYPGKIFVYRVFDIGQDVKLQAIQEKFLAEKAPKRFQLAKSGRAMIINNAPLALTIETGKLEMNGVSFEYEASAKIWHFGAVSINLQFSIPSTSNWNHLIELGAAFENDLKLHQLAQQLASQLVQRIDAAREPNWETFEDYTIYFFKSLPGCESNASQILQNYDVARLILSETHEVISEQLKKGICESAIQYGQSDIAIVNWNSALIVEPSGSLDIPDTIEFALTQLLEMRYYDDVLDQKLASLYEALEEKTFGIWQTYTEKLAREAARKYLEISETVESVENSLKVVGDFYLAQIFRAASNRFRFNDWRESVNQKLTNLAEISKLVNAHINERRNQLLEIIIIILIAVEATPFLISLFKR